MIALVLSGCGSDPVKDTNDDVTFTSCSTADCAGTLPSGAEFDIILPENWNGTLAIYSHRLDGPGAVAVSDDLSGNPEASPSGEPTPSATEELRGAAQAKDEKDSKGQKKDPSPSSSASPTPSPVAPPVEPRPGGPELAPLWGQGDRAIADLMLQAGYAIAGATPSEQGWVVSDQILAAEELHDYFRDNIGAPNRVYVWGESTGGLASARLAELHPEWVSGALALCAPLAGPIRSYDLALDVAYAIRETLEPGLKLVGYVSEDEARRNRDMALRALQTAAAGPVSDQAKIAFVAGIGQLPNASRTSTGSSWQGQIAANLEGIRNLVDQSTIQRFELEQRVGGNFSGNAGTDYGTRLTAQQREQFEAIDPGLTDELLGELRSGVRVTPDAAAVEQAAQQGTLEGNLEVPTLSLHNALDPVYIAPNVSSFRDSLEQAGSENVGNLVGVFALPPETVSETDPAAEGIGNCNFESRTVLGAMIQLNQWVRNGVYPGRDTARQAFKSQNVSLDYDPGPWPQMSAMPLPTPTMESSAGSQSARMPRSRNRNGHG